MNSPGILTTSLRALDLFFQPFHPAGIELELAGVFGGRGHFGHDMIKVALGLQQQAGAALILYRGARQSHGSRGFIEISDGLDACIVL